MNEITIFSSPQFGEVRVTVPENDEPMFCLADVCKALEIKNPRDAQSPEYRLEAIPLLLNRHGIVFSKTMAANLVGGRGKLGRLIEQGKVRVEKKASGKQNGKWYCNGGDVFRNIRI